ncbi:MAG: glycosyltransferase family 2 protein [Lachnospiraceae bacterium]|nr:glycosyltransferase family 2 protein [Lachnospiraceae bacterium]
MKKIAIIPAYNEEKSIVQVVRDIQENAPGFDYVVINDCSTDGTREVCRENGLNFVDLPVNLGIGGAVQTGYRYAQERGYDIAVQFDGDGQHDAAYLNEMADYLVKNQCDMVIGSRFIKKEGFQSSYMRQVGIKYFSWLIRLLTGQMITDATSGMRMVGRDLIDAFAADYPRDYPEPESTATMLLKKKKIEEYPVKMRARTEGVSSISPLKSVYYMIKVSMAIILVWTRR